MVVIILERDGSGLEQGKSKGMVRSDEVRSSIYSEVKANRILSWIG